MSKFARLGAIASLMAVATALASPAMAQVVTPPMTIAGTDITNTVSVAYKVDGIDQTAKTASDTFKVDRKVNLVVTRSDAVTTKVIPGALQQTVSFTVSNQTNAVIDIALAAANRAGDQFDGIAPLTMYRDAPTGGTVGAWDALDPVVTTHLENIAAETSALIFVKADIPLNEAADPVTGETAFENGDLANIRLTGTAHEAATSTTLGAAITASTGSNTVAMETVFADSAVGGNTAKDGIHFADDSYEILTAALSVVKSSKVLVQTIADDNFDNPGGYAIPGATIEYCIRVANTTPTGGPSAQNVVISDVLPTQTTHLTAYGVKVNGTYDSATSTCTAGPDNGSFNDTTQTVSGNLSPIGPGATSTLMFRVKIK